MYGSAVRREGSARQVEIAIGQQERVGEHDFVIHAVDRDHGRGAVLPALPNVADALGLPQRPAQKGVDTDVANPSLPISSHM